MTSLGRVRVWHAELGWGVIDSELTPSGCWAHYSSLLVAGYRTLEDGQEVRFRFEVADQDGYSFRAVEVWPADQAPVHLDERVVGGSSAMGSELTVTSDADGEIDRD